MFNQSIHSFGKRILILVVGVFALGLITYVPSVSADGFGPIKAPKVNAKKAALGKRLFFDQRLSGDAAISCATCHIPEKGFGDGLALSKAYPGSDGFRNTPTLINTAQRAAWFHDGRLGTNLNDVTRESITETYNMNMDMRLMQERIKQDPVYVKMFKDAGYGEPSNGSVRKAIPEYLKTLTSRGSAFDVGKMTDAAKRGFELFKGKAGCASCHSGNRFTDDQPHNTGAPNNPEIWKNPRRHLTYVAFGLFMGIENIMNIRRDVGAHVRTHKADGSDIGKFMTPTLRELKYTAPYMHNGMIKTLKDVVEFYNNGGGSDANKDPRIKPLGLSKEERANLVTFLNALSGKPLTGKQHVWPGKIDVNYKPIKDWLKQRN
ncbi:MAG: c-type cytochrome [Rhodospirillaceae bacterium]|jgi:cytochrome c peroxidase|nr:c-type cytochrome [Rhodospirillaceae bacterium]MBT4588093.1 c-type cytochrome [Rhodospirillaceae bacterium]MBT4938883.1 c-type cytochrome [Rhodospirillaceae bacterium]MBT5940421.1 c-type cytochrome [Rhodospirillaceae bacterium]MBT7269125.1 c-type cytochrome [Rhodospirillaceae bacterium]